ncbi:hypothetical protein HH007_09725 [Treponema denticola]|uniref:hypothetical protein n=1 Tax=Treponema denticola TaxID=158 RepID=UPI003D6F7DA1
MTEKHTDNSKYKHSHPKNAKSEAKYLTRSSVPDTIFSNKQQATSNKQQATSNKQQATSNKQQATSNKRTERYKRAICSMHPEHTQISSTNNTHRTEALSSCVFYITPFKETATPAENAKDYKRMSYKASLKTSCVLGVLRG